jgi:hypothetical protein
LAEKKATNTLELFISITPFFTISIKRVFTRVNPIDLTLPVGFTPVRLTSVALVPRPFHSL